MTERMKPYVGVSGLGSRRQHHHGLFPTGFGIIENPAQERDILVGVKATHKTQILEQENKYGRAWFPVGADIGKVLGPIMNTRNAVQLYMDPQEALSDSGYAERFIETLKENLLVSRLIGSSVDTYQFDKLPYLEDPERFAGLLAAVREDYSTIVQCYGEAMAEGPVTALDKLKRLTPNPSYVLFDASHGAGRLMDPAQILRFLEAGYNDPDFASVGTNFAVAGGLDAQNVQTYVGTIFDRFPEVSWDAEGHLHNRIEDGGDGSLDMERVRDYLTASAQILWDRR